MPALGQLTCMDMGTVAKLTVSHHHAEPEGFKTRGKVQILSHKQSLFRQVPFPQILRET